MFIFNDWIKIGHGGKIKVEKVASLENGGEAATPPEDLFAAADLALTSSFKGSGKGQVVKELRRFFF